jgi:type II secretory pathway component GspD/PulD (secretin)
MVAATGPATAPSKSLAEQVEAILPSTKIPFEYSDTPVSEVIASAAKSFGFRVIDQYQLKDKVTMRIREPLSARDALVVLEQIMLPLGYTIQKEILPLDPPVLQLRIVKTTYQANVPVFTGTDPEKVPQGDELRTQVIPLKGIEADKAREMVAPVLDRKAEMVVDKANRELIITDSGSHIRTALTLIQVLEKQAAENKGAR